MKRSFLFLAFMLFLFLHSTAQAANDPTRPITEENQPDSPCINVVTDNPVIGGSESERAFWLVDDNNLRWHTLTSDENYWLHFYIRVSGSEGATGVTVNGKSPEGLAMTLSEGTFLDVCALSKNAKGAYHQVTVEQSMASNDLILRYVPGSLKLYSAAQPYGVPLDAERFFDYSKGVTIGYADLDGEVPSGLDYACEIVYQVYAQKLSDYRAGADFTPSDAAYQVKVCEITDELPIEEHVVKAEEIASAAINVEPTDVRLGLVERSPVTDDTLSPPAVLRTLLRYLARGLYPVSGIIIGLVIWALIYRRLLRPR